MFEKESEEYGNSFEWTNDDRIIDYSKQAFQKGATFGYNQANKSMNWILGWLENEKENRKEFEDDMKRGYLAYIYQFCATKSLYYNWKCVDPKYYTESKIEDFKKKYSVTGKLYVDFYELYYDLIKLNTKGKENENV